MNRRRKRAVAAALLCMASAAAPLPFAHAATNTDWQTRIVRCSHPNRTEYYTSATAGPAIQKAMTATFYQGYNMGRAGQIFSVTLRHAGRTLAAVEEMC